jgi:membrane associated rhomboid family serine protease
VIPLRDRNPTSSLPVATLALIAVNVLVFCWEIQLGPRLERALFWLALIPARYSVPELARQFSLSDQLAPFFTSMFLHGGWIHLIGNMWILWIFGDNVEDRLGRMRYLGLYLLSGIAAALLHIYTNRASMVPTIGASGAVAGIMGAYFRYYPKARVVTIIPPFFLGPYFELPAVLFLGWWFLMQFFNGALSLSAGDRGLGGIAWWAHVGGFVFALFLSLWLPTRKRPRRRRAATED